MDEGEEAAAITAGTAAAKAVERCLQVRSHRVCIASSDRCVSH